jgi:hypothetical protein
VADAVRIPFALILILAALVMIWIATEPRVSAYQDYFPDEAAQDRFLARIIAILGLASAIGAGLLL